MQALSIPKQLLNELATLGQVKQASAGDIMIMEEQHVNAVPLVLSGILKVSITDESGQEILLYYLKPGETCVTSVLGALHQKSVKVKAEVEEDAEILFLPVSVVNNSLKDNEQWLSFLLKSYHERFEDLILTLNEVAFKNLDQRLISHLQKKAALKSRKLIDTTHEQLARELGTSRVVISRLLKKMEDEGMVKLSRNQIELIALL